jgi:hypothetical protein
MRDLTEDDILPDEMWDRITDAIDERCKLEDAKSRRAAGYGMPGANAAF